MAKLKLQPDPTFKAKVAIVVPGAEPSNVVFTFKHRSRQEMDRFLKAVSDMKDDVEMVMALATGWDLADDFTEENVRTLVDSYISAPAAIFEAYLSELTGNRRKN
jgi:hypothetical protein